MGASSSWQIAQCLLVTLFQQWINQSEHFLFPCQLEMLSHPLQLAAGEPRLLASDPRPMVACANKTGEMRPLGGHVQIGAAILTVILAENGVSWRILGLVAPAGVTVLLLLQVVVVVVVVELLHLQCLCQCPRLCPRQLPHFRLDLGQSPLETAPSIPKDVLKVPTTHRSILLINIARFLLEMAPST